jgi:hypothetical protein
MGKSRRWRTVLCDTLITHQSLSLFLNFLLGWRQGLSRKGRAAGVSTTLISWLPCSAGWKETRELKWFTLNDLCTTNESMGCQTKENTTRIIPVFRMSSFMSFLFLQLLSPPELGDAEINFRLYPKGICVVMIRICKMTVPERTFMSSQGSLPKKFLASI